MAEITPIRQGMDEAPYWPGAGHEAAADIADLVTTAIAERARSPFADRVANRLDPEGVKTLRSLVLDTLAQAVLDHRIARINAVEIGTPAPSSDPDQDRLGQVLVLISIWLPPPHDISVAEICIPMIFP